MDSKLELSRTRSDISTEVETKLVARLSKNFCGSPAMDSLFDPVVCGNGVLSVDDDNDYEIPSPQMMTSPRQTRTLAMATSPSSQNHMMASKSNELKAPQPSTSRDIEQSNMSNPPASFEKEESLDDNTTIVIHAAPFKDTESHTTESTLVDVEKPVESCFHNRDGMLWIKLLFVALLVGLPLAIGFVVSFLNRT